MQHGSAHGGRGRGGDYVRGRASPLPSLRRARAGREARGVSRGPKQTPRNRIRPVLQVQEFHERFTQMLSENPFTVVTRCACSRCGEKGWPSRCWADAVVGGQYCFACPRPCTPECSNVWCMTEQRCELKKCECTCDQVQGRKRNRAVADEKWRGKSSIIKWPKLFHRAR